MWKSIEISRGFVKAETVRAILIGMPCSSDFDGCAFWHPSKLIWAGRRPDTVSIRYTDDFVFRLKKYGAGRYNFREIIEQRDITPEELADAFARAGYEPEEPEIYTPEHLEPEGARADESLIDYD